jgi:N4-(beta-N-acetylglucosaminyl)-L-asparaginase
VKLHGRVGDSLIIGAGLYVDGEIGAATSTGVGEEVIRNAGSFLVVELMRQGRSPQDACREAVERIAQAPAGGKTLQVGFIAGPRRPHRRLRVAARLQLRRCDAGDDKRLIAAPSLFPG